MLTIKRELGKYCFAESVPSPSIDSALPAEYKTDEDINRYIQLHFISIFLIFVMSKNNKKV